MTVLLDTTVLIDALRNRGGRRVELERIIADGSTTLATSAVNVAEVYAGARPQEENRIEGFLSKLEILSVTPEIGRYAGKLKAEQARLGRTVSLADILIAATALENHLPLMTENRKHFADLGLQLTPEPQIH